VVNDYLVQRRTANHDSVATQLTHYKTNSFAIQNQASHITKPNTSVAERQTEVQSRISLHLNLHCGSANRRFDFHNRRQYFIGAHDETLSV